MTKRRLLMSLAVLAVSLAILGGSSTTGFGGEHLEGRCDLGPHRSGVSTAGRNERCVRSGGRLDQ